MAVVGQSQFVQQRLESDETILTMLGNMDTAKIKSRYEKLMHNVSLERSAGMCWPVDWFPEALPTEDAHGQNIGHYLDHLEKPLSCISQWPQPPVDAPCRQEDILVFSDAWGFCKDILEQAPPGRIGFSNVQTKVATAYDDRLVKKLVTSQSWDLILVAVGIDPPNSNSVDDVHRTQDAVLKLMLQIFKCIADNGSCCKRMAVITCDTFANEKEIHEECGIGLITNSTLWGMVNTARQECQIPIQFIDTEWALRSENTKYLAAEIFRHQSFGHNTVRILNRGRFVQRLVPGKKYELQSEWQLPDDGVIGISGGNGALGLVMGLWILKRAKLQGGKRFKIQFLSRSMKVQEENMKNWNEIEKLAGELGIEVEHAKCDVSKKSAVDDYIQSVTPNLTGFIHSAGVLRDGMLYAQTWEKFDEVFESKSRAALFVHDALERNSNPKLNFFWLFSSTATYGNMGQINYSASNSYLDALARHRRALGKPCMAPQWGAWGDVGMAANLDEISRKRMVNSPVPYFTNAEGLYGLECGLRTGLPGFQVCKYKPEYFFFQVQADDTAVQCFNRNTHSILFPPPPTDPEKNYYTTLSYSMRSLNHKYCKALVFQHFYPKQAELEAYEDE